MLQFYKPNENVKGSAMSVWQGDDKGIMVSLIKQGSWDSKRKIGSFSKNKDNPAAKIVFKLSVKEVGDIIYCIDNNVDTKGYHNFPSSKFITQFYFQKKFKMKKEDGNWIETNEQKGYSLRVIKEEKEDSTSKVNIAIGLENGELIVLKEYLLILLRNTFNMDSLPAPKQERKVEQRKEPATQTIPEDDEEDIW